jgi:hypothetical protein
MTHLLLSLSLLAPNLKPAAPVRPQPIELAVGYEQVIKVSNLSKLALGDERVADVKVMADGELLLLGKGVGHTTLLLWTGKSAPETREVIVRTAKVGAIESSIHEVVADSSGIKVYELNGRVVIAGELYSAHEYGLLKALVGDDVVWMVSMHPVVGRGVVRAIDEALVAEGFHQAHARLVGDKVMLEGQVQDDAERNRAQAIAESVYASWQKTAP